MLKKHNDIISKFNNSRNNESLAHDVVKLPKHEERIIFDEILDILYSIESRCIQKPEIE